MNARQAERALRQSLREGFIEDWEAPGFEELFGWTTTVRDKAEATLVLTREVSRMGTLISVFGMRDAHATDSVVWNSRLACPLEERYERFIEEIGRLANSPLSSVPEEFNTPRFLRFPMPPEGMTESSSKRFAQVAAHQMGGKVCETKIRRGDCSVNHWATEMGSTPTVIDFTWPRFITLREMRPSVSRPFDWYRASTLALMGEEK